MNFLFPITTTILIVLGAFCIYISIDNSRRTIVNRTGNIDNKQQVYPRFNQVEALDREQKVFKKLIEPKNSRKKRLGNKLNAI